MADEVQTVFIVDDDPKLQKSLEFLIRSIGVRVHSFSSATDYLASTALGKPGCLLLDLRMPEMSGLELQSRLNEMGFETPIVILTGHADVRIAVQAMRAGAIDVIQKPYSQHVLLNRVQEALNEDRVKRSRAAAIATAQRRLALLTSGEREVLERIHAGLSTKEIAAALGLSPRGIQVRRANIMRKLPAETLADLIRLVMKAEGRVGASQSSTQ